MTSEDYQELEKNIKDYKRARQFLQDFRKLHYPFGSIVYVSKKGSEGYGVSTGFSGFDAEGKEHSVYVYINPNVTWRYPLTSLEPVPDSDTNIPAWIKTFKEEFNHAWEGKYRAEGTK